MPWQGGGATVPRRRLAGWGDYGDGVLSKEYIYGRSVEGMLRLWGWSTVEGMLRVSGLGTRAVEGDLPVVRAPPEVGHTSVII